MCRKIHIKSKETESTRLCSSPAVFVSETKSSLQGGEVIVLGNFPENYSFIIQDAAQGFHWNNQQATIHPLLDSLKILRMSWKTYVL
jgi:hypothetical protein